MRCSETGGPGIDQVQILGDGEKSYFLAKLAWGKEAMVIPAQGSIVKWNLGPDRLPAGWAALISPELKFGVNSCLPPQPQLQLQRC